MSEHEEHTTHSQGILPGHRHRPARPDGNHGRRRLREPRAFQPQSVALLIATIKATLVVLFFMHVKGASEKLTGAVVVSGFFFLAILISLSLADYLTRSWR
jgi:hypothetical protein